MNKIRQWIDDNGISIMVVSGAFVIISQWATCTIEPNVGTPADTPEEVEGE